MRSRPETRWGVALVAAVCVAAGCERAVAAADLPASPPRVAAASPRPDRAQIEEALRKVRADRNLGTDRWVHMLRWQSSPERSSIVLPSWLKWLRPVFEALMAVFRWVVGAAAWLAESGRMLLWALAAVLVGLLGVYLVRALGLGSPASTAARVSGPSFVRDLDIRPESLPDDIGATAAALWTRGDHRGALALLYRGLLSRLVHRYGVPVKDSSTEGACLELIEPLPDAQQRYAAHLIRAWQLAVYGGVILDDTTAADLCAGFAGALDPPHRLPADPVAPVPQPG